MFNKRAERSASARSETEILDFLGLANSRRIRSPTEVT